jgi:hypothetical protein
MKPVNKECDLERFSASARAAVPSATASVKKNRGPCSAIRALLPAISELRPAISWHAITVALQLQGVTRTDGTPLVTAQVRALVHQAWRSEARRRAKAESIVDARTKRLDLVSEAHRPSTNLGSHRTVLGLAPELQISAVIEPRHSTDPLTVKQKLLADAVTKNRKYFLHLSDE